MLFFVKIINLLWPFWPLETSNGQGGLNSQKLKIWRFHELYDQKIQIILIEFPWRDSKNNIWALLNVIGEHTNQRELRKTSCWKKWNTKMGCSLNKSTFVWLKPLNMSYTTHVLLTITPLNYFQHKTHN